MIARRTMTTRAQHRMLASVVTGVILALSAGGMLGATQKASATLDVTPVEGPSTLHHLRRTIDRKSVV